MGKVYKNNVLGYAGGISRSVDDVVESFANADTKELAFGQPVFLNAEGTGVVGISDSSDPTRFVGITVRSGAKTPNVYEDASGGIANSVATYKKGEVMDVLTRGSIVVECTSGTVKPGMPVYFNKMVGAASATSSDLTITVPGVNFRSTRDGSGRAEILVKERHLI